MREVEPLQHRFAYVGTDLQDLFGVQPGTIGSATALQDNYFQGCTAQQLMGVLAARPDAVLVSAETVADYQLHPGDLINLRLPDASRQLRTVPFHYVGIVTEFPTAPEDSLLVANADDIAATAASIQALTGPTAAVTDITSAGSQIGTSLTSVDLSGLTAIGQGFALLLAAAAGGLVVPGLAERRRSVVVAAALGARSRQLLRISTAEAVITALLGLVVAAAVGYLQSTVLVAVLSGVFDPPPAAPAIPALYLSTAACSPGPASNSS